MFKYKLLTAILASFWSLIFVYSNPKDSFQINNYEKEQAMRIRELMDTNWMVDYLSDGETIIFSSDQLNEFGSYFIVLKKRETYFEAVGIEQKDGEYKLCNVKEFPPTNVDGILKEIANLKNSSFYGLKHAEYGYQSYIYVAYILEGRIKVEAGFPILRWGSKVKQKIPISGENLVKLWELKYKMERQE